MVGFAAITFIIFSKSSCSMLVLLLISKMHLPASVHMLEARQECALSLQQIFSSAAGAVGLQNNLTLLNQMD